jgi:hypothetical protein
MRKCKGHYEEAEFDFLEEAGRGKGDGDLFTGKIGHSRHGEIEERF